MTKIKLCGLTRPCDIEAVNRLLPEYIGFVFAQKSKRYITLQKAVELKKLLNPAIQAVGVFVQEKPQYIAKLLNDNVIDIAQLHGGEDERFIKELRTLTEKPIIQAFSIKKEEDIVVAQKSLADFILLDSGSGGTGVTFDWTILKKMQRPYFLAGGLDAKNIITAIKMFSPYAVDVSSGIETQGVKDKKKMKEFVHAVQSVTGKDKKQ